MAADDGMVGNEQNFVLSDRDVLGVRIDGSGQANGWKLVAGGLAEWEVRSGEMIWETEYEISARRAEAEANG